MTNEVVTDQAKSDQIVNEIKAEFEKRGILDEKETVRVEEKTETEEEKISVLKEDVKTEVVQNELTIEEQAKSQGWSPKGEKSAQEWVNTTSLYDGLKSKGKEIKELRKTLNDVKAHMEKQQQRGYEKALEDLISQKNEAILEGNIDKVTELDKEIAVTEKDTHLVDAKSEALVQNFYNENTRWITDPSMNAQEIRDFALKRDNQLAAFNLAPQEHLDLLTDDLHKKFNSYFNSTVTASSEELMQTDEVVVPIVESTSKEVNTVVKSKMGFNDLNDEQKKCCARFVTRNVMTQDEYIKSLKDIGEL